MEVDLGTLKKIDIRKKWKHEANDFTPWLALNIENLANAIGMELELEGTEVAVGPYSADILAKDPGTSKYVVIENQLTKTDHDHLGKSITYASVLDASSIIWIAPIFTEEHIKALEWLNDNTSGDISFFGVSVELWQIDDSKPAIRFNVINKPTEIVRQTSIAKNRDQLTETTKMQLDFWTGFREKLKNSKKVPSVQSARPQYWYDVSLGRSGIHLSNTMNTFDNVIGVRVYISNKIAKSVLPQLLDMKEEIENEIGQKLEWDPSPESSDKSIRLQKKVDLELKEKWDEYQKWMVEYTIQFRAVFSKRVKGMDFSFVPEEMNDE